MSDIEIAPRLPNWFALEITIARDAEDAISSMLWEYGTLGIVTAQETTDTVTLQAYFDTKPDLNEWREWLIETLVQFEFTQDSLHDLTLKEVPNEDWLKKWKESYLPFNVGEKIYITPSWTRDQDPPTDRVIIQIDPGMAFGTGTHETTRLCMEAIERYWQGGRLLDVGTGTSILAMTAIKLVPESEVVACDNDPEAIIVAQENIEINRLEGKIQLAVGSARDYRGGNFHMVVANLTADVITPIMGDLVACLAKDGKLVLSGILAIQELHVTTALNFHAQRVVEIVPAGEWIAIISEF